MWTAKDFNDIAKVLKQVTPIQESTPYYVGRMHQWESTVEAFVDMFWDDPKFDRIKFYEASGYKEPKPVNVHDIDVRKVSS